MADDTAVPRDRQIRTEALHAATRLGAEVVVAGEDFNIVQYTHVFAHYIHAGIWLISDADGNVACPFGDMCRFNRKVEW